MNYTQIIPKLTGLQISIIAIVFFISISVIAGLAMTNGYEYEGPSFKKTQNIKPSS